MTKIILTMLICCSLFPAVRGQVTGKLVSEGGQPIPSANVLLLRSSDTSLAKAAVTDAGGAYRLEGLAPGTYLLKCSCVGYQTWTSSLFQLADSARDFGVLTLKNEAKQVGEVVIRAERPPFQQRSDGLVVNLENSLLAKGSSALEALQRSPGVAIDYQNGGISLNGKSGVVVMLNGKLLRMPVEQVVTLLSGMSADNIDKIELLTTPPSKYDAEGSAGMINIVLKKSRNKGTNGSVALTGGVGWGEKGTAAVNLSHNSEKVDLTASYVFTHDRSFSDWHAKGTSDMALLGGETYTDFLSNIQPTVNNHNVLVGIDARLTPRTTIGASVNYIRNDVNIHTVNQAFYNVVPDSQYNLNALVDEHNRWNDWITSLYANHTIRDGEQFSAGVDYLHFHNYSPTTASSSYLDKEGFDPGTNDTLFSPLQQGYANTVIQVAVGKLDYTKRWGSRWTLETGVKGTYTWDSSSSGINSLVNGSWVNRSETTSEISMREYIYAAYASVNAVLSSSTTLTAGVRYEYSRTKMENPAEDTTITDRRLGVFFPNVLLSKKLNDHSGIDISYTKRITRPSYNDLASFVTYTSPNSVESGNPLLLPTITNILKVAYHYNGYAFSVTASRDDNPIAGYQLGISPSGDLVDLMPENMVYQNNLTFQANIPVRATSWWSMAYSLVGGWKQFKEDYTVEPAEKTYFSYSANTSQQFKLPWNAALEVSAWYNSLAYNGTKKVEGFGSVDVGVKKDLKNNGGSFQLSVTDLFKTVNVISYYGTLTKEAFSMNSRVVYSGESGHAQIVKLTYSRSFGGASSARKRTSASQEERDRIRQ